MARSYNLVLFVAYLCFACITPSAFTCDVRLRIKSGWICGRQRLAENEVQYASFRRIPYAQQPLGKLRFKELQPVKSWTHDLDATEEGPICPQYNELYGTLVKPDFVISEECIYANVHVPMSALKKQNKNFKSKSSKGLPIVVLIHGGAFQVGSGDSDLHGPEYLVSKGVIVVTFNYRLNVFGFLSLNSPKIPGNNGLRDQVTLLRWVQTNAKAFGGDPKDVTLVGQSAGAACAHLLSLTNVTKGLFKRVIIMSGTAIPAFYSASPIYANYAATRFLTLLGINSTDADVIHDKLVNTPLEEILRANNIFQNEGLVSFVPVVEGKHPGVTRLLEDDPITLIKSGRGNEYPLIVGSTNSECEFFKRKLETMDILSLIMEVNPLAILPARIAFNTLPDVALELAQKVIDYAFNGAPSLEKYMDVCRDVLFGYSTFKLAQWRAEMKAAPTYLYQFSYESDSSAIKAGLQLQYNGSAHIEDLTYVFRVNAVLGSECSIPPTNSDVQVIDWMTDFVINFIQSNEPSDESEWLPVNAAQLTYLNINQPDVYSNTAPTQEQKKMIDLYDEVDQIASQSPLG